MTISPVPFDASLPSDSCPSSDLPGPAEATPAPRDTPVLTGIVVEARIHRAGVGTGGDGGPGVLAPVLAERVGDYARASRARSTWRAYDADLRHFHTWCAQQPVALVAIPAEPSTVAGYLVALADAGYKPSTIRRRLAAISVGHQLAGQPSPTSAAQVGAVWDGIRRTHGMRPTRKTALDTDLLARVVAPLGDEELADVRDRALLLVGFAGCLRRGELVGLDVADLDETPDGLVVHVRRSKTDQDGAGALVGITYGSHRTTCPVRAWTAWARRADLGDGPAFRGITRHGHLGATRLHPSSVARIVQRRVAAAGLDAADFAGHSLRSGFATAAARAGVHDRAIMRQGRWRSAASLDAYVRPGRLFDRDNPSGRVGL
ncbi:site-specific integrase [Frankia sp. R82]|uniref:site-specific integrase n=1 Tax=Frankia sp. R82 TaxID=2950553 RepID=UPI0020441438|nr:site-specific integrase [Frankia sp. R82]MCM3887168.1 tyrosine-type recombinase/integrase [Frankia sp. R82]